MSIFVQPTEAPAYKDNLTAVASLCLAAIFILMAVGQLFKFERFPDLLGGYWIIGGQAMAHLLAALLVTAEVFALPFLLRVRVSPLMRIVSLLAGGFVALSWLLLSFWVVVTPNNLVNAGIVGASVRLHPGVWQIIFSLVLVGLVIFTSWKQKSIFRLLSRKS